MTAIVANRRFAATEEIQLSSYPSGPQGNVGFVALAGGGFVAIFDDRNGTNTGHVLGRIYDSSGRPVGDNFLVDGNVAGLNYQVQPNAAPLATGGFIVTWVLDHGTPGNLDFYGQIYDSSGQKVGGILPLNTTGTGLRTPPEVTGLASGGFVTTWHQDGAGGFDEVRAQVFNAAGAPVGGEIAVQTTFVGDSQTVDITALSGGGFVIVWDNFNYADGVRAQIFNAVGAKVGGEIAVSTAPETQDWPAVASLPSGGFVVVWRDDNGSGGTGFRIKAQIFDSSGAKVGAEFAAAPGGVYSQSAPTVSSNAAGEFVIGWAEFEDGLGQGNIKGRLFSAAGAPIGDVFTANVITAGAQNLPAVTMLATGGLVMGWSGPGAQGDLADVKARVFFPVVQGTAGADTLTGNLNRNFIDGLDGNDQISGGLEDDGLIGGGGHDGLDGGEGNDELEGGDGNDTLTGGSGNDLLDSGATGNDGLDGGDGADVLLVSGAGTDSATGGTGSDTLIVNYGEVSTAVTSSALSPTVPDGGRSGSISTLDRSVSFTGIETFQITTGSGNDDIRTGPGDDIVSLGAGDDRIDMGTGLGRADGGSGTDGIAADLSAFGQLFWSLQGGPQQAGLFGINNTNTPIDTFKSFEYFIAVVTGSGNDSLTTTALALNDDITTGGGDDSIQINHGHDVVRAGTGSDTLSLDYSGATTAIVTTGFVASGDGTGHDGIYAAGDRSVTFTGIERVTMAAGSGNDVIRTGAGQDSVYLNGGDDFVDVGSSGGDTAYGGDGVDGISADISSTTFAVQWNLVTGSFGLFPTFGEFEYLGTLTTGSGNDTIVTANLDRDEQINTGVGNDTVTVMNGDDVVNAGSGGTDTLVVDYRNTATAVVSGPLTASAGGGHDGRVAAGDRAIDFTGVENFQIFGGSAADDLKGGAGADRLNGGGGVDTMAGGLGNDIYTVEEAADVVIENAGEGTDTINTTLAVYSLVGLSNVENLGVTGLIIPRDLRGNSGNNVITGGSTADVLRLYDGGDDTVNAGSGNDNIFFGAALNGADVVNGGIGTDTLVVQGNYAGGLTLSPNITLIENISILGGGNTNFGDPGTNLYDYVLTTNDANFAAGVQARINGAALLPGEDFTFNGSAETNASFVVYGGKGVDTLTGGYGNDIFIYAEDRFAPGDTVNGGPGGYDGIFFRGNYTIDFNAPGYFGLMTGIENMTLMSITDERYSRGGDPAGFDYNITLADNMLLAGIELTVSGVFLMAGEIMIVDGSQETDGTFRLFGGKGNDSLKGGGQNDLLLGNLGADQLTGGGGSDTFRFDSTAESNSGSLDQILDFTPGTDKIDLIRTDANTLVAENQFFTWIGSNAFSGTAGQLRVYEQGGTWYVEGDVNGDAVADLVIALTLQGPTPLGQGDFLL